MDVLVHCFMVTLGLRQGDPASPYMFLLCAEILALLIRNDKRIKGMGIGNIEYVSAQFADDATVTVDRTEKGLYTAFSILNFFTRFSGLKAIAV